MTKGYNNNPNLPREDYRHAFTQKEMDEFIKTVDDDVLENTSIEEEEEIKQQEI